MRTVHWNGEHWYENNEPLWQRFLGWLIWPGGWLRWDRKTGRHKWARARRWDPTPLSVLGHRFTHYGRFWQLAWRGGWFVWLRRSDWDCKAYWSPNGTPTSATFWLGGAPKNVEAELAARRSKAA